MTADALTQGVAAQYFHVSRRSNRDGILAQGLLPLIKEHNQIARVPAVYLFGRREDATYWAFWSAMTVREEMDIWEVSGCDCLDLAVDTYPEMDQFDAWKCVDPISIERIRLSATHPVPKGGTPPPPEPEAPVRDKGRRLRMR